MGPAGVAAGHGRRGAIYIPLILVGASVMSEPLFALLLLGALAAAIQHRRSTHRWRWVVLSGVLAGLTCLDARERARAAAAARARGVDGAAALSRARARRARRCSSSLALVTVSPWTIRNAIVFHRFIPVSTQLGSALAGTYNDQARLDAEPRVVALDQAHPGVPDIYAQLSRRSEPDASRPAAGALEGATSASTRATWLTVAEWTTLRMLDLGGLDWSRHTASTISVRPGWAIAGRDLLLGVRAARAGGRVHEAAPGARRCSSG